MPPNHIGVEGEGNLNLKTQGPDAICHESEQSNKCASKYWFKLNNNILGFEYISKTGRHSWTPLRVQRVGAKDSEFDAAFLEECEEVSFINVGGSLRAKVLICQATFLTPISARTQIIQRLATNLS